MIAAAFISDRGNLYLPACLATFGEFVRGVDGPRCIVDDATHNLGLAGAVQSAWAWALATGADYLFHVEEDFTFRCDVDATRLAATLDANPHLAQVVLKRQPWNEQEKAAGGIIETAPDAYTDGNGFVEHEVLFSLNPCLIPRRVLQLGWPAGNEAGFSDACRTAGYRFAFYGHRDDAPLVRHDGFQRGTGWRL